MWLHLDRSLPTTLQQQIAGQIQKRIQTGELGAGTALPSTRGLAEILCVSRNTVTLAYERLEIEGYVKARPGAGTRVCGDFRGQAPHPSPQSVPARPEGIHGPRVPFRGRQHTVRHRSQRASIDFWVQRPDPRSFPLKAWRRLLMDCLAKAGTHLVDYGDPVGLRGLREAIARHVVSARGIRATADSIFIFAGAQLALNMVARLLIRGASRVVVENPSNQGASYLFESYQARLLPVPVDGSGLITERLPSGNIRLAYVTPSHQFPLGVTMSLARRLELLDWADRTGAYIVEDDYDGHAFYDAAPLPALKALRDDRVIYLGTFSKALGAGLRIGYAVLPPKMIKTATTAKALLDNGPPWLEQAGLQAFIENGSYFRHARRMRNLYLARRNCLVAALTERFGETELSGLGCGTHVSWHLPRHFPSAKEVQERARRARVSVYTLRDGGGEEYRPLRYSSRTIMLGYSTLTEAEIRKGVTRIADALSDRSRRA